jgi:hypothetical protein
MKKTISIRQVAIICFIATLSLKTTILPSMLYKEVGIDSLFIIIIYSMIDLMSFLLIYQLLKKNQDISFYTFLCKRVGKVVAKIILFIIFIFYFFKMQFLTQGGFVFAREVVFQEADLFLFIFILLVLSGALYLFRLKSYARTVEFFYPVFFSLFIIFLIIPFFTTKIYDIRPIFETETKKFLTTTLEYLLASGNFIFLLLFMGKIKFDNKKADFNYLFARIVIGLVLLILFYFTFNSAFKYTGFLHANAVSDLVQFVPAPSILGNFDLFTISLTKLLFGLQGGLFTYAMCEAASGVIKFKNYNEQKHDKWVLFSVFAMLLISIYFIFNTFENLFNFSKQYGIYLSVTVILIPLILFLTEIIKRKRRVNEKNI